MKDMKKIFTLFVTCLLSLAPCAWAQTAVLVLNDTVEYNLSLSKKEFTLSAPCDRVMFSAKHTASATSTTNLGDLEVEQYVNNKWETIYKENPGVVTTGDITIPVVGTVIGHYEVSVEYETITLSLNRRATKLRFSRTWTNDKQIKNIQAYMASFVELSPATMDFGELVVRDEAKTLPMVVTYCNVAPLKVSSTNPDFVLSKSSIATGLGVYAKDTVSVTFSPVIRGEHTSTIVVTNGAQTDSIHCRAKVTKRTPVFNQEATTLDVGEEVAELVTSDCDNRLMLEACNPEGEQVLVVDCGVVKAVAPGTATITAMQLGDDDYWNNKVETYTIQVTPILPTSVSAPKASTASAQKTVRNGMVYVEANDNLYHINGQQQ